MDSVRFSESEVSVDKHLLAALSLLREAALLVDRADGQLARVRGGDIGGVLFTASLVGGLRDDLAFTIKALRASE